MWLLFCTAKERARLSSSSVMRMRMMAVTAARAEQSISAILTRSGWGRVSREAEFAVERGASQDDLLAHDYRF